MALIRQLLLDRGAGQRLKQKLHSKLIKQIEAETESADRIAQLRSELDKLNENLKTAAKNLAPASSEAAMKAIECEFESMQRSRERLYSEWQALNTAAGQASKPHDAIESAFKLLDNLETLAEDSKNFKAVGELFRALDLEVCFRFREVQKKIRVVNQMAGGVITLGDAPAPTKKYSGLTGRRALIGTGFAESVNGSGENNQNPFSPDDEAKSLGNRNRDDRI